MLARWLLLIVGATAVGCLDDLPAPLACPPDAQVPAGDCATIRPPLAGCFPPQQHACMAGERTSCACAPDECPEPEAACFPADSCPALVTGVAGDAARCERLTADDAGDHGLLPPGYACTCGCLSCLSTCDGKGPTFGATLAGDGVQDLEDFVVPLLRIDRALPAAGRLGLYVRMRALTTMTLQIYGGDPALGGESLTFLRGALLPAASADGFVEHVLYDELIDAESKATPLRWSSAAERPTLAILLPFLDQRGHTLLEIDCVIPFWLAP